MINLKKIISLLLVAILLMSSGCSNSNSEYKTPDQITKEVGNNLMLHVKNKDVQGIKELLCPRFNEKYKDIDKEIQGVLDFIEGDIISYDEPSSAGGGGDTAEEGWVERYSIPEIGNIETNTGKKYVINCFYFLINKEEPDLVGIETINVILVGDETGELTGDDTGEFTGKLKNYRISVRADD